MTPPQHSSSRLPGTTSSPRGRHLRALLLVSALALLALATSPVFAPVNLSAQATRPIQASDTLQELRLTDGSLLIGRVVSVEGDLIVFQTTSGLRVELNRDQIRSMVPARGEMVNNEFWPEDPNQTRLMVLSPTGRTLPKGEGYLSAFWIFLPFVGYGVTDDFTLAGGTPVLPNVIGRIVYLAPKLRVFDGENLDLALGALAFFGTEELDEGSVGLLWGVGTVGPPDHSLTAGAGWAYAWGGEDPTVSNDPLIVLGGEHRAARRLKLVTENYFVPGESGALLTGGLRFIGDRLSVDFGIGVVAGLDDDGDTPWFPLLNFVYNFGGDR